MKIISHELRTALLAKLIYWLLRALRLSWNVRLEFAEGTAKEFLEGPAKIYANWHGTQIVLPILYAEYRPYFAETLDLTALISRNKDGRLAAAVVKQFGIHSVAGSSSRGGSEALVQLIRCLRSPSHVCVTPDGPRGPREEVKPGVVLLAQRGGVAIAPIGVAADRAWYFNSWDRMFLPKPFSKVVTYVGKTFTIDPQQAEEDEAKAAQLVKIALDDANRKARELLG